MIAPQKILVDIDALAARHPALSQAVDLAKRCGAHVKLVDILPDVPRVARRFVTGPVEAELVSHRRDCLSTIAAGLRGEGVETSVDVLRGKPAIALVQEVLRSRHGLLVRSHGRTPSAGAQLPFGSIDMHLLRLCPCPVWLISPLPPHRPMRVVAAVHANPSDQVEQRLNTRIIHWATSVAQMLGGDVTLLQAWSAFGEDLMAPRLSQREFAEYVETARRAASDDLQAFVAANRDRLVAARVELAKGFAEDVIPQFSETHETDLVVMGTVARTGISGFVIGNTAERILQRLRCSVLAVKPEGFVSPIRVDDARPSTS